MLTPGPDLARHQWLLVILDIQRERMSAVMRLRLQGWKMSEPQSYTVTTIGFEDRERRVLRNLCAARASLICVAQH